MVLFMLTTQAIINLSFMSYIKIHLTSKRINFLIILARYNTILLKEEMNNYYRLII